MILPCKCGKLAIWWYMTDEISDVFCDDCVPRGCGCNVLDEKTGEPERDEKGRLKPCCEWAKEPWGVPDGFEEDWVRHWGSSSEQDEDEVEWTQLRPGVRSTTEGRREEPNNG